MSYRLLTALLFAFALVFALAGVSLGQSSKTPKKDETKEDEKPLTAEEMHEMMEEVEEAWNKLKIHARNKMGDKAASAADDIAKAGPKLLRYDGKVLTGDNKDKLAREQQDYKDWAAAMVKAAEEYAKYARKSDWDKAGKEKDKLNDTCGACHKVYQPAKAKVLTLDEFKSLMDDIKTSWNALQKAAKDKNAEKAAAEGQALEGHARKILGNDSKNAEGKLVREQEDFKKFAEALRKAAEEYAALAKDGEWTKAAEKQTAIGDGCADCHDVYKKKR